MTDRAENVRVASSIDVRVVRVYEPPKPDDGARVLVDRLWPRGLAKAKAALDEWCKEVAPSQELRAWYAHDRDLFGQFEQRYRAELTEPERAAALVKLTEIAHRQRLTLLTATKAIDISHAEVLRRVISE